MRIIKPYVEQLNGPIDGMQLLRGIELAGRVCYKSEQKITETSCLDFVKKFAIGMGHESMLEHGIIGLVKFVCDRGVSHEIVRHRLFSYSQESTRYVSYHNGGMRVILPMWLDQSDKDILLNYHVPCPGALARLSTAAREWLEAMTHAESTYNNLYKQEWKPQHARSVLPNSLKTEIVVTGNIRNWRHFFKLRCAKAAHPQMREVAIQALKMFRDQVPVVFDDIEWGL